VKVRANPKVFMFLAAIALVGGLGGSYFQWSSYQEQVAKAEDLRKQMRDENETRSQVEESSKKLTETAELLGHLEKGVPQMAYVATLLKELDKIGTDNGLLVLGVRPVIQATPLTAKQGGEEGAVRARKPYEELNIEVKCRGKYRGVMAFVEALQKFPKIVAARTISLTPKAESAGKESKLDVIIELRAYLFPQAQPSNGVQAQREEAPKNNG
jgi:Tfp pilus assembly protein PilO